MAKSRPDDEGSSWRRWLPLLETVTIACAVSIALGVSSLDLLGLLGDARGLRIPAITLLLLGILGAQQAFERSGQLRTLRDQLRQSRDELSSIIAQVREIDRTLDRVHESLVLQPVDGRFDRALKDVSAGLKAAARISHPDFHDMISRHLEQFRMLVNEWQDGTFRTQGAEYHQLLHDLYLHAKVSVFSTSAPSYLPTWRTALGSKLLAAHELGKAEVTRVFLFSDRAAVTGDAIEEMRRQARVRNVSVRVYIKNEDAFFRLPVDMSDDFTVIDDGEVIGTTVAFGEGDESRLTASWFFDNIARKRQFTGIVSALKANRFALADFEAQTQSSGPR